VIVSEGSTPTASNNTRANSPGLVSGAVLIHGEG